MASRKTLISRDLHSVDLGVVNVLYDQVNATDWDVIVAHFLGIDHAGHRYGPDHVEMKLKLAQVDVWINRLLDQVDDDTIVWILGDHGMDGKGRGGFIQATMAATDPWRLTQRRSFIPRA